MSNYLEVIQRASKMVTTIFCLCSIHVWLEKLIHIYTGKLGHSRIHFYHDQTQEAKN